MGLGGLRFILFIFFGGGYLIDYSWSVQLLQISKKCFGPVELIMGFLNIILFANFHSKIHK